MNNNKNSNKRKRIIRRCGGGLALLSFILANNINVTSLNKDFGLKDSQKTLAKTQKFLANRGQYTFKYLNSLDYRELVETIKKIQFSDVPGLFEFSNDSYEFFNNRDRVLYIIDELYNSGKTYTKDDAKGIPTLVEFLRAGFYIAFYNKQLNYLNELSFKDKCIPALKAIEDNENFALGTWTQDRVVESLGKFMGNGSFDVEVVNKSSKILDEFYNNFDYLSKDRSKGSAVYEIIKNLDFYINNVVAKNRNDVKNTIFYKNIDLYIESLDKLVLVGNKINEDNDWIVNNAIYFGTRIGKYRSNPELSHKVISDAIKLYPYLSYTYFEALTGLENYYSGKDASGNNLDLKKIKEEAKNKYLPKKYEFDGGRFIVQAGDKVSEEKIKRLYWASKEVKAQFLRVIGSDKVLDKGHADDVLKVVIYNSPKEYKLNTKLYGYTTDNGGIYIEPVGTFFTYERTPQESIYTLEELFRHEFTHYLQGRYEVPGMWGQGPFYPSQGGKLTWYDEGTAEFFAGSTRTNGIKPRRSVSQNISYDRNKRMNANDLLHVKYGSWDFYNYGFAFANYMYNSNIEMFQKINDCIRNNDINGYNNYVESISKDSNIENQYQNYMDGLVSNLNNLKVPLVSDDYVQSHEYKISSEVYNNIKTIGNLIEVKVDEQKSQFFNTFDLKGIYVGEQSSGKLNDWNNMNDKLNKILLELNNKGWSGYKTITAYFTNYRVENGRYVYDIKFHGLLTDKIKNNNPEVQEPIEVNSNIQNNDNQETNNKIEETSKQVKIDDKEIEDNNTFDSANIGVISGKTIKCNMSKEDGRDIFCFEVEKEGEVSIKLDNPNMLGITWLVYSADNLKHYMAYTSDRGNLLKGKFDAKPGKYYLAAYKVTDSDEKGSYDLTINGNLKKEKEEIKNIKETKEHSTFETAMKINSNSQISSSFKENDNADVYEINLDKPSNLNIVLEKQNDMGINWLLYKADDKANYIAYGNNVGNKIEKMYKANKGKYYLYVYKYQNGITGNYKLNVTN